MPQELALVGIASSIGGNMAGCEQGPKALRASLIPKLQNKGIPFNDFGNTTEPRTYKQEHTNANSLDDLKKLYNQSAEFLQENKIFTPENFPVLLGGDHSCNYPFIRESAHHNKKIGIIWFDAHGDFNTPDITPSGNIHGMVLSALAGTGLNGEFGNKQPIIDPTNICIVGTRDIDPKEEELLKAMNVRYFSMTEIQKRGLQAVVNDAISIASKGTQGMHLSFDMDVFDPQDAPDISVPAKNGLHKEDVQTIATCFRHNKPVSIDVVEVNPFHGFEKNKTADIGANIVLAFLEQ